jgi:hypothetical protein
MHQFYRFRDFIADSNVNMEFRKDTAVHHRFHWKPEAGPLVRLRDPGWQDERMAS